MSRKSKKICKDAINPDAGNGHAVLIALLLCRGIKESFDGSGISLRKALMFGRGIKEALTISKRNRLAIHFASRLSVFCL